MKSIQAKSCPSELCLFQFWNTYIFKLNSYRIHVQHLPCLTLSLWASKVGSFKQNSHTSALWSSVVDSGLVWALPNPRSEPGISYFLDEAENNSKVLWIGNLKCHNWLSQLAKGFCPNLWESMHAEITWNCSGELWLLCKLLSTAVLVSLLEAPALRHWDTVMSKLQCVSSEAVPTFSQTVQGQLFRIHMSTEPVQAWILSVFLKCIFIE